MNPSLRYWLLLLLLCGHGSLAQTVWLDVSIEAFEPAPASDEAPLIVSEPVRQAEARYLSTFLRYQLEASEQFGAVRVLPMTDSGADIQVQGRILASDGELLRLQLLATDSRGQRWLDQQYEATAVESVSLVDDLLGNDDFASLFSRISRDLITQLNNLNDDEREALRQVSRLRYADALLPAHFQRYWQEGPSGERELRALPASDDPLMARIDAVREREYLFIDVVDSQYQDFFYDILPIYRTWRQVQREQRTSSSRFEDRRGGQRSSYTRGSYYDLLDRYHNYRWAKMQELYRDELDEGFSNEAEPTELSLNNALFTLSGSLDDQYREWRRILAEMYQLEYGEPPGEEMPADTPD